MDALKNIEIDVIVDGTTSQDILPVLDSVALTPSSLCYDLKYSRTPTAFMRWAQDKNASIISDGLGMLVEQAAESFCLWTGYRPKTKIVIERAKDYFYGTQ